MKIMLKADKGINSLYKKQARHTLNFGRMKTYNLMPGRMNLRRPAPAGGKEMHVVVEFNSFKVPNKGFAYCYLAGIPLRRLHRTARRHREEDSYFGRL